MHERGDWLNASQLDTYFLAFIPRFGMSAIAPVNGTGAMADMPNIGMNARMSKSRLPASGPNWVYIRENDRSHEGNDSLPSLWCTPSRIAAYLGVFRMLLASCCHPSM